MLFYLICIGVYFSLCKFLSLKLFCHSCFIKPFGFLMLGDVGNVFVSVSLWFSVTWHGFSSVEEQWDSSVMSKSTDLY